jgi:ubiquinone/menaquinone biosynthesis C-methylase UbiE
MKIKTSEEIWNLFQKILDKEDRNCFDANQLFVVQEMKLKRRLMLKNKDDIWNKWLKLTSVELKKNLSKKYSSKEYFNQKVKEYCGRDINWNKLIGKVNINSKVIDVGSNEGDEVATLPYKLTCADISEEVCLRGKKKFPHINFVHLKSNNLPFNNNSFDIYISLRTWCVSGIQVEEVFKEARRVVKKGGLIIISLPLVFITGKRKIFKNCKNPKMIPLAKNLLNMFKKQLYNTKTYSSSEDYFIYGRN